MEHSSQIPSLPELALQYGTISTEQFASLNRLSAFKKSQGSPPDFERLLLSQKFATQYQVGLLKLIREYMVIKKRGEEFGKIAIEKGFAIQSDIDKALEYQKMEFKRAKARILIGDILVESQVISIKQKHAILKQQTFLDTAAEEIFASYQADDTVSLKKQQTDSKINLSGYEKQFLHIQVLDQEFAASVIEKSLASEREVKIAQKVQEDEFEKEKKIRILGDIMVELKFLTEKQKTLILKEQGRIEETQIHADEPAILLTVSPDQMEALVQIKTDKSPVSLQDIKQALTEGNIRYGVYPDVILQCNLDMENTEFIAAKQDFSLELIKAKKAMYHFDTRKIDTEIKKKGAALVEQRIGTDTYLKKDLFGNNIEQTKGHDFTFKCGSGTRLSKDRTKAFAAKTGFPSLSIERKLYIHPLVNVLEDADLKYGPLEMYANINISGVLTGAYPVTAGKITAREIRGATIEAIGSVRSQIGMTDSIIAAQGDIHARYLHHCKIETFGNVYVENEIIDSQVFCSGKIDSKGCRVVSSSLYAKNGITLAGVGNSRTKRCVLGAGTEHHILEKARQITMDIKAIRQQLDDLSEKINEQHHFSKKTFQKMIELKIFHDRAKTKKQKLSEEFKKRRDSLKKEKLKNIVTLINNFEKRIAASISSLKELNEIKKKYEKEKEKLERKRKRLEPKIKRETSELKIDLFAFFEWARKQQRCSEIKISGTVFQGTLIKGVFSSLEIKKNLNQLSSVEKQNSTGEFTITLQND